MAVEPSSHTYIAGTRSSRRRLIFRLTPSVRQALILIAQPLTSVPIAFDQQAMLLYVSMHQVFSIWILPYHKANVSITTVLHLVKSESLAESGAPHERKHAQHTEGRTKYYIQSQQDMYQTSEFIKFVLPWFGIGTITIMLWQFIATFFCVVGAIMLWPISWLEENVVGGNKERSIRDVVGVEGYQAQ